MDFYLKNACAEVWADSLSDIPGRERDPEFFIVNLLVRIHYIIVMIQWTGLEPWGSEFPSFHAARKIGHVVAKGARVEGKISLRLWLQ